jgi:1,4-dihydroxy-2-naphthoyl-CoA synthase
MATRNWTTIKNYTDIKFDFFEGIAKITINRPRVYNAFRPETNMEMLDAMNICRERNDISVIVLTGAGDKAELIVMTHSSNESSLSATVKDLKNLPVVTDVASVLRVEGVN